jgi:prepilin-type N-terminal cleavage/methylation domain-containing protein
MRQVKGLTRLGGTIREAFTLIELLVAIAVITLLLALLLPALQKARSQARTTFCQANLHEWGIALTMYANDFGGAMPRHFPMGASYHVWPYYLRSYYKDSNDLLLCPAAVRRRIRPDNFFHTSGSTVRILGSTSTAWEYRFELKHFDTVHFTGSYGISRHVTFFRIDDRYPNRARNSIPVLLDCVFMDGDPWPFDHPPEYQDEIRRPGDIKYFCLNRHDGGINCLFLNWSVRKVGLKELWTLRWDPWFSARMISDSPWTKAGGVQPEDWPAWMRGFKDY